MIYVRLLFLYFCCAPLAEARTWTDNRGRTVDAEFEAVQDGVVILKKADGSKINVKLSTLSHADRKFISENKPAAPLSADTDRSGKFGFASVTLNGRSKTHPSDSKQKTQDLVITFSEGKRTASEYELRIAFVSGSPDGEVSAMGLRAAAGRGGFSNGKARYPLAKDQLNITELKVPIPRYGSLIFIGYQVEILDGDTIVDKHYWEDGALLDTIARKLQIDKDWWIKDAFGP